MALRARRHAGSKQAAVATANMSPMTAANNSEERTGDNPAETLRPSNPLDSPVIHANYFADLRDTRAVIKGLKIARNIGETLAASPPLSRRTVTNDKP